jgi:hypothetical protein
MIRRGKHYRLNAPTIALVRHDAKNLATTIPAGGVVEIMKDPAETGRTTPVRWDGKDCEMFTIDLRERGEEVKAGSAGDQLPF